MHGTKNCCCMHLPCHQHMQIQAPMFFYHSLQPSIKNFHPVCWMPSHNNKLNSAHRYTRFSQDCAELHTQETAPIYWGHLRKIFCLTFLATCKILIPNFDLIFSNFSTFVALLASLEIFLTFLGQFHQWRVQRLVVCQEFQGPDATSLAQRPYYAGHHLKFLPQPSY